MLFIAIMFLTTASVASAAAFFSVYGLAHTFSGAFWSVVFMGGSVEAGKLVLLSFLYRFRNTVDWKIKIPAVTITLAIMLLTSLGIYGYLSAAYQTDTLGMKQTNASLELKKQEQAKLEKRKIEIDTQITQLPSKDVRGRQRLQTQFQGELTTTNDRLQALTKEMQELTDKQLVVESHVGPIVFIAKAMGADPDSATNILILLVIFVFDPLAILLTILTNIAIQKRQEEQREAIVRGISNIDVDTLPKFADVNEVATIDSYPSVSKLPANGINGETLHLTEDDGKHTGNALYVWWDDEWIPKEGKISQDVEEVPTTIPAEEPFPELEDQWVFPSQFIPHDHDDEKVIIDDVVEMEPPVEEPTQAETTQENVNKLIEQFSSASVEDMQDEPDTEAEMKPIAQIDAIYETVAAKPDPTPEDAQAKLLIEKFYARQKLVRNTRNNTST